MNQAEPQKGGALKRIQSNPNHILAIISVLIIALLCQSSSVEAPALQYIANAFPSVPMTTITMLVAGVIYAWSILKAPLADEFGWSAPVLALNFTLTMCFFCIGGVISGILTRKTSPKLPVIVGAILAGTGFCITSRMSGLSATTLYLAYGVLSGLGIGMAYNAVISATNAWFPDQKGTWKKNLMDNFFYVRLLDWCLLKTGDIC